MSDIKNKIILTILSLSLTGGALLSVPALVYAQSSQGPFQTLIQKLAERFGLKQADVQSVFDQVHTERQAQMKTKFEDRLTQAVKDGKISEVQKQLILVKFKELQDQKSKDLANWQNMTPQQRRDAMLKNKQDLEDWAKKNNIDIQYLFGFGRFGGKGFGMKGWRHFR